MKRTFLIAASVAIVLSGCVTAPVPVPEEPTEVKSYPQDKEQCLAQPEVIWCQRACDADPEYEWCPR